MSGTSPRKRALSRTCPRGHGRVPFGSGRVPGCPRTGPGTMSECGAGTGVPPPIPSTAHMCEARSGWEKASTGPGPDWSVAYTLGPLSDTPRLQPSTVRCIGVLFVCGSAALSKQQLVFYTGFAVTSNDSNRHICITSQHLQLNSRPPRLCDRPGRASPPKVVSPPRIVKLRTRLQRRGAGLWGGWQQHSRRYSFAVEQGLVVMTQGGS